MKKARTAPMSPAYQVALLLSAPAGYVLIQLFMDRLPPAAAFSLGMAPALIVALAAWASSRR